MNKELKLSRFKREFREEDVAKKRKPDKGQNMHGI